MAAGAGHSGHAGHGGKDSAIELLLEQPERIEPGLVVLAGRLRLDEHVEVDALLRDTLGYPVVIMISKGDIAVELGRMAAVAGALARGRYLLAHLFGERGGLDPSLRPRFVLLANRFPDNAASLLDMMSGVEVQALEYRVVTSSVGRPVLDLVSFHRTAGPSYASQSWRPVEPVTRAPYAPPAPLAPPALTTPTPATPTPPVAPALAAAPTKTPAASRAKPAAGPPAPAPTSAPGNRLPEPLPVPSRTGGDRIAGDRNGGGDLQILDEELPLPDSARGFFQRARESIRSLSSHVTESNEDGQVRYRVKDKMLATLILDPQGFRLRVGDQGGAGMPVADEATFNAGLNSVFTLYFDRLGPDRPTA